MNDEQKKDMNHLGNITAERVEEMMSDVKAWSRRLAQVCGVKTIEDFNRRVEDGTAADVIHVTEVLQARRIAAMADEIAGRGTVRTVLIAGPSSSGKTTFSKRLSIQLMAAGLKPVQLSTDDYFVNREQTPKDENGKYDFESLYAVDLDFLNDQLAQLTAGKQVELPRFNFETGLREFRGDTLTADHDTVIVIEGIHALNPLLTKCLREEAKYRIFCSVLSDVPLDGEHVVPAKDVRLLRRILRDSQYRGYPAEETIRRWPSVGRGEEKWIFPFMGEADTLFDSSFFYELAVMKGKLRPRLKGVGKDLPEYDKAQQLLTYLDGFTSIPDKAIPPTSLLREFFGGSSYKY